MLYGSVMPFLEFLPWGIILCPAYLLVHGSVCGPRLLGSFFREFMVGLPATVDSPPVFPHARVYLPQADFPPARYPPSSIYLHWLPPAALSTAAKLITPSYLW